MLIQPTPSGAAVRVGAPQVSRRTVLAGLVAAPLALGALPFTGGRAAGAVVPGAYAMGYFTESPNGLANDYALHLAVSTDGLEWTPLNQNAAVVRPTAGTGGLRDPFILRKQDDTFVVLATDMTGTNFADVNQFIHVWDSPDLRSFTGYRRLKLHDLNTHAWAPEAFWDPARGQYGILCSIDVGGRNVIQVNYTSDFVTVSPPQTYFDPGFGVLDATLHVTGGVNYFYYKRESDNSLFGARSTSLAPGTFTPPAATYTRNYAAGATEAPIVVKANDSATWYLWGDSYAPVNGEFYVWRSTDITRDAWVPLSNAAYTQPLNSKHATIVAITTAERDALLNRWGAPAWTRIKSLNFPDRYVRHAGSLGRIDPYPMDPFGDSQWRIVPGLAGASGMSFESVNFPGRFLRHQGFAVRIDPNDGSPGFAADATFTRVAGLADGAWSSFRSWNYPDRYLRHSGFALRVDPVPTTGDRADATFRLVS